MPKTVIIIDYKIIHMRTFGLSMQNKGPAIVKLTIFHNHEKPWKIVNFTIAGPLFCIDSPNVRMWIILLSIIMTVFVIGIIIICVKVVQTF